MTDQPKWTKGPWAVERNKRTWGWVDVVGPSLGVGGPTQATDLTLADEVKRIAEAHLIAAAPDLYAALEACVVSLERANTEEGVCCCGDSMDRHSDPMHCGHSPVDMGDYYAGQALEAARAALAKARGQA